MAQKIYVSTTGVQYTFPAIIKNKEKEEIVWVFFNGDANMYTTSCEKVQKAIENSIKYKNGEIALKGGTPDGQPDEDSSPIVHPPHVFFDVPDINGAVEILTSEPYNISKRSLKTPAGILSKVKECNVEFPNLVI
jgi:hypothetical protein